MITPSARKSSIREPSTRISNSIILAGLAVIKAISLVARGMQTPFNSSFSRERTSTTNPESRRFIVSRASAGSTSTRKPRVPMFIPSIGTGSAIL